MLLKKKKAIPRSTVKKSNMSIYQEKLSSNKIQNIKKNT